MDYKEIVETTVKNIRQKEMMEQVEKFQPKK